MVSCHQFDYRVCLSNIFFDIAPVVANDFSKEILNRLAKLNIESNLIALIILESVRAQKEHVIR